MPCQTGRESRVGSAAVHVRKRDAATGLAVTRLGSCRCQGFLERTQPDRAVRAVVADERLSWMWWQVPHRGCVGRWSAASDGMFCAMGTDGCVWPQPPQWCRDGVWGRLHRIVRVNSASKVG